MNENNSDSDTSEDSMHHIGYDGNIGNLLEHSDAGITDVTYTDRVEMIINIPQSDTGNLENRIRDITHGRVVVNLIP